MIAISGSTRVAGVIGAPVRHSLSPVMHNAAFEATGLDWRYLAFEVAEGAAPDALAAMRTLGLGGLSVTMPHKTAVADACDDLTEDARLLRSVNCVVPTETGRLLGASTDGDGFVRSLVEASVETTGRTVALLGAGGAARAVALALVRSGADVVVTARRAAAALDVVSLDANIRSIEWADRDAAVHAADIVVNCTPLGMLDNRELPVAPTALRTGHCVVDLVYRPLETPLLAAARASGAATVDGFGMLVHQAAIAFELWTGVPAPVDVMRQAGIASLAD